MKIFFLLVTFFSIHLVEAQLLVDNTTQTPAQLVQSVLLGNGITISNLKFNGSSAAANAMRDQVGKFSNGISTNIGLSSGLILATGKANVAIGPNNQGGASQSPAIPTTGDADLALLTTGTVKNIGILEFDFIPSGNNLHINFVFASEEYPEFVGSTLNSNDVFGVFISGPGINGPYSGNAKNIALIPSTTTEITINNLNATTNWIYYTSNGIGTTPLVNNTIQYDGFTKVIAAFSNVQIGQTYHIKLAIANVYDNLYDSAVFFDAASFTSNTTSTFVSTPTSYQVCNDNNDGVSCSFVLNTKDSEISTQAGLTISYHLTPTSALTGANPIPKSTPYCNLSNPQMIYPRVYDPATSSYLSCSPFQLVVNQKPVANHPVAYHVCDEDTDGIQTFNLQVVTPQVLGTTLPAGDYTVTYYTSLADAQAATPFITPLTAFVTASTTVWIRVQHNTTGCYDIITESLVVDPLPLLPSLNYFPQYELCETTLPVCIETFDLTTTLATILNGQTGMQVTFYPTLTDADNNTNPITNPSAYNNVIPCAQTLGVRITNTLTGCYVNSTMDLVVNPKPVVTVNSPTINQGASATITTTPSTTGIFSYLWSVPTGATNPGNVASFITIVEGSYTVIITNIITGCQSNSATGILQYAINNNCSNDITIPTPEVLCGSSSCTTLTASYFDVRNTNTYTVSSIPYVPAVAPNSSIGTPLCIIDDAFSDPQTLPFKFSFFGACYDKFQLGTNTFLTFNATHGVCSGSGINASGYVIPAGQTIPSIGMNQLWRNSIYFPMQDTNPNIVAVPPVSITYIIDGLAPCRKAIINVKNMPLYSCGTAQGLQESQLVLYEGTNIIDIYVKKRSVCSTWNNGSGVIGIQNATATNAFAPPERNTGTWIADNEAWRFTPAGPSLTSFQWLDSNGATFGTTPSISVCPTSTTTYTAQVSYTECNLTGSASVRTVTKPVTVEVSADLTQNPISLIQNAPNTSFNLSSNVAIVLGGLPTSDYSISFYNSQADAQNLTNSIAFPNSYTIVGTNQTIYMSIECLNNGCILVKSFNISLTTSNPCTTVVTPLFTQIQPICQNSTPLTLPSVSSNGIIGFWSPLTIETSIAGTTNYTFTPYDGQCATPTTISVVVNSIPTPIVSVVNQPTCTNPTGTVQITSPLSNFAGITPTDLFISEVTDSNNGALCYVELYNGTGTSVNLSNYSIKVANNGGVYGVILPLNNVNLISGSTYVVALGAGGINVCNTIPGGDGSYAAQSIGSGSVNFAVNGNDHIGLFNGTTLIDSWGAFGSNNWAPSNIGTEGADFRRKNYTTPLPNSNYNNNDWDVLDYAESAICANNDYSNIGVYSISSSSTYIYNIDGGEFQSSPIFTGLSSGIHYITVQDIVTGCISNITSVTINNNSSFELAVNNPTVCQGELAFVSTTSSITGNYFYLWTVPLGAFNPGNVAAFTTSVAGIYSVVATNMNTGCTSSSASGIVTVIPCTPNSGFHLNAFFDTNNNGIQDSGEINFPLGQFHYQVNNTNHNIFSFSGTYDITENNPNVMYYFGYTINSLLSNYFTVNPASYSNMHISSLGGIINVNFAVSLNIFSDLAIHNIPLSSPVPGFNYQHLLLYSNNGLLSTSGSINFLKDYAVSMVGVSEPSAVINANGFTYNFTNLLPLHNRTIIATMHVPPIPNVNIGQLLVSSASINSNSGTDMVPSNNNSSSYQFVVGSYDPNDIVESHGKEILYSSFTSEDYLYYTIRFENTGIANAIEIRIDNLLDSQLDESTLEMVGSSHDYVMDRVGNAANWKFNNIQLPPSVADSNIGKGYVMYKIKPKPGYAVGDIIPNSASIYFDTNPAIVTNTFLTEFVGQLINGQFSSISFKVYPNPAKEQITIQMSANAFVKQIKLIDMLGRIIKTENYSSLNSMEIINLKEVVTGSYFVEVTSDSNQKEVKKIIVYQN